MSSSQWLGSNAVGTCPDGWDGCLPFLGAACSSAEPAIEIVTGTTQLWRLIPAISQKTQAALASKAEESPTRHKASRRHPDRRSNLHLVDLPPSQRRGDWWWSPFPASFMAPFSRSQRAGERNPNPNQAPRKAAPITNPASSAPDSKTTPLFI